MEKKLYTRLFLIPLLFLLVHIAQAQQFSITAGSVTTCAGVLEDSGGPSASYGDNENYTVVICPDNPGDGISLQWIVANLSLAGPNNTQDRLMIWDGDNTSATPLGDYTGSALQGLIVSATTFNTTGCLTVRFISNGTGTGDFAASITCFTPCERPVAVASMSEAVPALVCVGEQVSFDGNASFAAPGFNITSYTWDFDDGTTATGPTSSHAFSIPGEYIVQLNLVDDNDCVNSNVVDLQVLVSTTPLFAGTVQSVETCLGATVDLSAIVTPVTWTGIPDANFGEGVFLPDDVGQPFTSDLSFTQFDPGQSIQSVSNILSICVEMEHSYMGDLVLQVICPNGQTMIFHQQGGGGTYLGAPNDTDSNQNPIPGECWEYCWSPTATNGTWVDNSNQGSQNTTSAGTPPAQSLNPGTYEPVQPFTNLVGCPLNGEWTYQSTDLWGADNGFICSWSINFDPNIIPDVTQFTPNLGTATLDSAGWSGPELTQDPVVPLNATATPSGPGTYPYTFFVTDDFGCSYDTTITIIIDPQIVLDAGPDMVLCSDPLPMAGAIVANGPPPTCTWELLLLESWGDGWNGGANLMVTIDGNVTNYSVPSGPEEVPISLSVETGQSIELFYTAGTSFNNENSFTLTDDAGNEVYASPNGPATGLAYSGTVVCGGGSTPFVFEWSPVDGLTDPTDPNTDVYVTEPTWFYLSSYPTGHPECAVMDSVLVSPDPSINAGLPASIIICESDPVISMLDSLQGNPDLDGTWTNSAGAAVPDAFDPTIDPADTYTYTVTSAAGCQATSTLDIGVLAADDPTCCGVVDAGPNTFSCDLTTILTAVRGNTGVGNWDGPAGAVFEDAYNNVTMVTVQPGMGGPQMFYWVENDGAFCDLIDSVEIVFTEPYVFTPTITDALCYGYCDGAIDVVVTGGNAAADLEYVWSNGDSGPGLASVSDLCAGTHTLIVTDDNGCAGTFEMTVNEPELLQVDSVTSTPVTCSGDCDGTVTIHDVAAVLYSFDNGDSWGTDAVRTEACEGIWVVRIKDADGCIGLASEEVTGPPPVVASFIWGPQPANVDAPTITFSNTSTGADHYFWNVDEQYSTTDLNTVFTFSNKEPDTYQVCLTAYNYNECVDTVCNDIVIDDVLFTYIPNAFTPDGDGENDAWWPTANIPVRTNYELLVFDRWGQVVFSTTDPYKAWEGSFQNSGEVLKSDVYAYRLLYGVGNTEARKEILGHVTLMK
ncbi:MAG: gliding motility-associated C-terminal domain-containing protein [Flavobacteriales bacterium]|nr:gliding motility-associated C-terminal domain-containing protein [Flavobacteriales bacterium]MCB9178268.1 gliding motility-associated C-terminal domain-containing protein [Flavobacteriales bacterium]HPF91012.1 PKD domain-containing protein [Flavobacteriales bacterium]